MKRILIILTIILLSAPLFAQQTDFLSGNPFGGESDSGFMLGFDGNSGSQRERATVSVTGKFVQDANSPSSGKLVLEAVVPDGCHMYSITQKVGGPTAARIVIEPSQQYSVGTFTAQTAPEVQNVYYYDVPIEEHRGTVVWAAPIQFAPGVDPSTIEIKGSLSYQICDDVNGTCLEPTTKSFSAQFLDAGSVDVLVDYNTFSTPNFQEPRSSISDAEPSFEEVNQNTSEAISDGAAKEAASSDGTKNYSLQQVIKYSLLSFFGGMIAVIGIFVVIGVFFTVHS